MRILFLLLAICTANQCQSQWSALDTGLDNPGRVIYYDSTASTIIFGGNFNYAGGVASHGIASWNGNVWSQYGTGAPFGAPVYSISKYNDTLVASSVFELPNPEYHWFYKWNGSNWDSITPGPDDCIIAFKEANSKLYIGGVFTHVNSAPFNLFGYYDGSIYTPLPIQSNFGNVSAIEEYGNNLIVAGNFYDTINQCSDVLMWDGNQFSSLAGGTSSGFDLINSLAVYNNELYLAGSFSRIGNCYANNIAKWDGVNFYPLGSGTNGTIFRIHSYDDGVYACGGFTDAGGITMSGIAKWDGAQWVAICPNFSNNGITDLLKANSNLYITGSFDLIDTLHCNNVAKYSLNTNIKENLIDNLIITPNPASEFIEIQNIKDTHSSIVIYNIFGIKVCESKITVDCFVDISILPKGTYFLGIKDDITRGIYKIIKI